VVKSAGVGVILVFHFGLVALVVVADRGALLERHGNVEAALGGQAVNF
jgi:hypothetical protein